MSKPGAAHYCEEADNPTLLTTALAYGVHTQSRCNMSMEGCAQSCVCLLLSFVGSDIELRGQQQYQNSCWQQCQIYLKKEVACYPWTQRMQCLGMGSQRQAQQLAASETLAGVHPLEESTTTTITMSMSVLILLWESAEPHLPYEKISSCLRLLYILPPWQ